MRKFIMKWPGCTNDVNYTEEILRDVLDTNSQQCLKPLLYIQWLTRVLKLSGWCKCRRLTIVLPYSSYYE